MNLEDCFNYLIGIQQCCSVKSKVKAESKAKTERNLISFEFRNLNGNTVFIFAKQYTKTFFVVFFLEGCIEQPLQVAKV